MTFFKWAQSRGRFFAILHDVCVVPMAWFAAFWLRFNLDGIPQDALSLALHFFPSVLLLQAGAYWIVGLYRGIWQFASVPDLYRILKGVLIGCAFILITLYVATRLQGFPRSVLPIYAMLLIMLLGGSRFFLRWVKEYQRYSTGQRVLVIGAGRTGEGLVRDLLRNRERNYKPIAFVDDKRHQQGQEIHGIRVVGSCEDIPRVVKKYQIDLIMIATPSANAAAMRRIIQFCEQTSCQIRTLPGLTDLVSGRVSVDLLREVSLEDLLGRDPVRLDWAAIQTTLSEKVVLVTGGGGSIGSELCRQIAQLNPEHLIVIERSEFNLFTLEQEFKEKFPQLKIDIHLLDVCDRVAMREILARYRPEVIFHAAAYKHVPMLETQPREAIINNVLGTQNLAELALAYEVDKFVLVSTDKAVRPTNIMGASKRVSEMICHHYNGRGKTQFITVRFGNVLGSAGSVIPIFKEQLKKGGPLTVTHPEITRFFMTIPEACQLILQALSLGKGGEIFVLDMGEPIKITFLAEQVIRLAGKKPGEDIEIVYTGLRPGEKLYEELFYPNEKLATTGHQKIHQATARSFNAEWFIGILRAMEQAASHYEESMLRDLLHQLVPELETQLSVEPKMNIEFIQPYSAEI